MRVGYMFVFVSLGYHNKHHRLGGINNRNLFARSYGGWKSTIKVPTGWFLVWPLSLFCKRWTSCWILTWPFLCACSKTEQASLWCLSSSYKDTYQLHLILIISWKALFPNIVTLDKICQNMNFQERTQFGPQQWCTQSFRDLGWKKIHHLGWKKIHHPSTRSPWVSTFSSNEGRERVLCTGGWGTKDIHHFCRGPTGDAVICHLTAREIEKYCPV